MLKDGVQAVGKAETVQVRDFAEVLAESILGA